MVKDLRTGFTSGTPDDVLDGDLDEFMQASLAQRISGAGPEHVDDVD
jgi:peptide chain release factor 2